MTWWMWFAAGMVTVVAALMLAALVSRWLSRQHPAHRAGIDEDEDDPEEAAGAERYRRMIGEHLSPEERLERSRRLAEDAPVLRIDPRLYPRGYNPPGFEDGNLGPPPTYPETPEEHTR
jgi:hypothetical protein